MGVCIDAVTYLTGINSVLVTKIKDMVGNNILSNTPLHSQSKPGLKKWHQDLTKFCLNLLKVFII